MTASGGDITAVLLAGGQGTRIRSLYPDVPKPMIPVCGKPFLYWVTAYLAHHGIRRFVYSTGYRSEQIEAWCGEDAMPGLTRVACREAEPLGTGGGLLNCLHLCGAWLLAGNADSVCLGGIEAMLALPGVTGSDGGIVAVRCDDTTRFGSLETDGRGHLSALREKEPGQGFINAGTYLFRSDVLCELAPTPPCSIENDLFPCLIGLGRRIDVVKVDSAPFIDIGTPETVAVAEAFILANASAFVW